MSARRVDVDERQPVENQACHDCGKVFGAGERPPYERIVRLTVDYGGALTVLSHNLCNICWWIYEGQTRDTPDGVYEVDWGPPAPLQDD